MTPELGRADESLEARRELLAALAHELRSPIGAILGFDELLGEGILGDVPGGVRDALARIRNSAHQLFDLTAGLGELSAARGRELLPQRVRTDLLELLTGVIAAIGQVASGRATAVELGPVPDLPAFETDPERLRLALRLALVAAIRSTAGGAIRVQASTPGEGVQLDLEGTGLEPDRDEPDRSLHAPDQPRLSGAGLRIAMARSALAALRGDVVMVPAAATVTLRILLPAMPAPARN